MINEEKFSRNSPTLSEKDREKIRCATFCIVGLGGVGGFVLENLARLGAQGFILFDHDRFELTNFNRQLLATDGSLDQLKADEAASRIRSINSRIMVKKFKTFDPTKIVSADIVIDGTDSLRSRLAIAAACRKRKIPYVFCSAQDSRGIVSIFTKYPFEKAFSVDEAKLKSRSCASVICPAVSVAGSLAAAEAMNHIIGKPRILAPRAMFIDLFDKRVFWIGELG